MSCTHITSIWSVSDSVLGERWSKIENLWVADRCSQNVIFISCFGRRSQSLRSLLTGIGCPSRCPLTCLALTSRLSDLKSTHYWVRDDGYLGLKKKFRLRRAPSSGISLSGGQVSDGRLRRGLIVIVEHPHDMLYNHITCI